MSAIALPQFTNLDIAHFVTQLDALLNKQLQQITTLLHAQQHYSWDNLMQPLEEMDDALERFWSPMSHLHAVVNSPVLRKCYEACLPKLSAYEAAIGQNQLLYDAIKSLDKDKLNPIQQKIVADTLQDFALAGVGLSAEKKQRFEVIQARLAALANQFENNVLDAGLAYSLHILDEKRLKGLPDHVVQTAHILAKEKELSGWVFNLEIPCYLGIVTYAEDRALREEIYKAYVTRASDQGPNAHNFDNTAVMNETLALRHEKAQLLGFANYAELSLATKMAESCEEVIGFLSDLSDRARQQANQEYAELQSFAAEHFQLHEVAPWDIAYLSEKKRQMHYAISQEALRSFFPLPRVMQGLFTILNKLYGLCVEEVKDVDVWHADVTCYRLVDSANKVRGFIYADLFARPHKRGGAWMDSCQSRRKFTDGSVQLPIATLTCNFAKTSTKKQPLLSHDEVLTLFHEFGHCLHHVLTQVDYLSASGINGVEWDAVELPSQFFENWCWEESALQHLTAHAEHGGPLQGEMFKKLHAAKNFQSAMGMMRQLEFSLFDFRIHQEYNPQKLEFIATTLADVRKKTMIVPTASFNRAQHSFTHIFSGGYAAGYYSYKWAEVLSSDAFSRFEEEGVFNAQTGQDFMRCILEVGGSRKAAQAFIDFRGRTATIDALLHHNGIG